MSGKFASMCAELLASVESGEGIEGINCMTLRQKLRDRNIVKARACGFEAKLLTDRHGLARGRMTPGLKRALRSVLGFDLAQVVTRPTSGPQA